MICLQNKLQATIFFKIYVFFEVFLEIASYFDRNERK